MTITIQVLDVLRIFNKQNKEERGAKIKPWFLLCFIFILTETIIVAAQGSNPGRINTPATPKKKAITTKPKTTKTQTKPQTKTNISGKKKDNKKNSTAKVTTADLTISVSEPNSEVFISNQDGEENLMTKDDGSPTVLNNLPVGKYTLTVRKEGFYDETRSFVLEKGKPMTISVTLRASFFSLFVTANVEGANIEIENVGEFENSVEDLPLKPGNYRINVYKNGYKTFTREIAFSAGGQKTTVEATLERLPLENFMNSAISAYSAKNYWEAIKQIRPVLAVEPNNAKANLFAGCAYYFGEKPSDGVYLLSRAVGLGEQIELPVRRFNKDKNTLQLIAGTLTISQSELKFTSQINPKLNFTAQRSGVFELYESADDFGVYYINLYAQGVFNGKNGKIPVRIYPDRAIIKSSKKETGCANCTTPDSCPCRIEEKSLYELLNRWRNNNFQAPLAEFSAVMPPSVQFKAYRNAGFSMKLPENWQIVGSAGEYVLAAPAGAFLVIENKINYSHGINAFIAPNPNNLNFNQFAENSVQAVLRENPYLIKGQSFAQKLKLGQALVNTFSGLSPVSKREEAVMLYTIQMRDGRIFTFSSVSPPDEAEEYKTVFRRILNSVKLPQ